VLGSIVAKTFKEFADSIESGASPKTVAQSALNTHFKCVFNGNGYSTTEQETLTKNGVWRIDSGIDAIARLSEKKNMSLFQELRIMNQSEALARELAMYQHYTGLVEVEAMCMIDMINQHCIPSIKVAGEGPSVQEMKESVKALETSIAAIHAAKTDKEKATLARTLRLETMVDIRQKCDNAEALCPASAWTLPTYTDLLFLDAST
jgi:glutamine synthetase